MIELAERYVDVFRRGKVDEAAAFFTPDVVRVEYETELRGDEITGNMEDFMAGVEIHSVDIDGPFVLGDRFAVRFSLDLTNRATGKSERETKISLYTVADGLIVREEVYRPV